MYMWYVERIFQLSLRCLIIETSATPDSDFALCIYKCEFVIIVIAFENFVKRISEKNWILVWIARVSSI